MGGGMLPLLMMALMAFVALVALLGGAGLLMLWGRYAQYGVLSGHGMVQRAQIEASPTPLEALRERYAHGEIDLDTFEEMVSHLMRFQAMVSRP